ncbi:Nuclear transport factor 2 [Camellia lanceoleosa]|uniref:Nuclear transport factor 2 n=1 Tax=Camellia lanceoleosa TaxID=1840588 RepID=A0ACC0HTB3_9ERIC|nr:Nuclear transport factor 2 [Camellia lanceoleosa]
MAAVATETEQPASAQVGNAIVQQYYHIQHQSPELVHRFYQDMSKLGRPDGNGTMIITTTMQAINEKILSLNCGEYRTEIKSVDAQESYNGGFLVLVTGYLAAKDNMIQKFAQTFFLAPQEKGYFILLLCGRDVFEQTMVSIEFNGEEALSPSDDGEVSIVEEEVLVADIVDEVPDDLQMVVESNSKIDEMPNKSYASIVMDTKESAVPLSSPAPPAPRRSVTKSQGQQVNLAQASASAAEPPLSGSNAIENGNNQEGEADGYSIYIKGLPLNTTLALLENEFKRFGPTKTVFKLRVTNSRDFVLALWNLMWQVLCKQQLRFVSAFLLMDMRGIAEFFKDDY